MHIDFGFEVLQDLGCVFIVYFPHSSVHPGMDFVSSFGCGLLS